MGFMDWAKMIGGGVAAPFTGGATLPIAMDGLSGVLGGAAKSGQDQNNKSDQLKLLLENAKLNRDKFALAAPGERLSTGMRANLAANAKPSKLNWGPNGFKPGAIARGEAQMPKWEGGPSSGLGDNMSPDAKQLSNTVLHDSLIAQLRGGTTGGGSRPGGDMNTGGSDLAMPKGIGEESTGDKILGGASLGTSILGLLLRLKKGGGAAPDQSGMFGNGEGDWYNTGIG